MAYGKVIFELASLVNQHFSSHPAFSSHTTSFTLACYRLAEGGPPYVLFVLFRCDVTVLMLQLEPILLPVISFLAVANGCRGTWVRSFSMFPPHRSFFCRVW